MRIATLGPEGTFSQQAAMACSPEADVILFTDLGDVFEAVECGECGKPSAYRADTCPKCEKTFLKHLARRTVGRRTICPHCKVDVIQYRKANPKKP